MMPGILQAVVFCLLGMVEVQCGEATAVRWAGPHYFLEHKLPKAANEYDGLYLDEFAVGHEWTLKTYQIKDEECREQLGYYEVAQDEDPARGKVIKVTLRQSKYRPKLIGYDFHCQIPSEVDAYTFYAKLDKDTRPITLNVGHDTRRVPGTWFTSWCKPVTIDSYEWKKYIVTLDGKDMKMQHRQKMAGEPGYPTTKYSADFVNEIFFLLPANSPGTFFLDDGCFERLGSGRKERTSLSGNESKAVRIVRSIDDFEVGIGKLGRNATSETYQKGNWAYSADKHYARINAGDAASGKQSALIFQGAHEQDNLFEEETGPAPQGANALSFHLKVLDWQWMSLVKKNEGDARLRYPFYIYAVLWTIPAADQHRMVGATGNDLYSAEGCRWSLGNKDLVDKDGKRIPRALYLARARVDFNRLDEWQHFVIPFSDFSYAWGMEKSMEQPVNPADIYHVGVYSGAKDMFSTTYLLDELSFAETADGN